jgi:ferritin-like metal-binding protein YciE
MSHEQQLRNQVNDVMAIERDIVNAIRLQQADDRVHEYPELGEILTQIEKESEDRQELFRSWIGNEGMHLVTSVKEGISAVTGVVGGLYTKLREYPVSRMVRDDIIALDIACVSYGMLHTLGLAIGNDESATLAERSLKECPPFVIRLTDLLPEILVEELSRQAPLVNPAAAQVAYAKIRDAWNHS